MENREFFETIVECIESGAVPFARNGFCNYARNCGYTDACLDAYDEAVEYRRIYLSHYYNTVVFEDEVDFDGKPFGPPGGSGVPEQMEAIMGKYDTVRPYIYRGSMTFAGYRALLEQYDLVQ